MKKQYIQPACLVCEVELQGLIAMSIPNGGEIPIGGGGHPDAPPYRGNGWTEYELEGQ